MVEVAEERLGLSGYLARLQVAFQPNRILIRLSEAMYQRPTSLVMRLTDPDVRSSRGGAKSMVALGHGFDGFGP